MYRRGYGEATSPEQFQDSLDDLVKRATGDTMSDRLEQIKARADACPDYPREALTLEPEFGNVFVDTHGRDTETFEFIAHARADITWLLAEHERLTNG